MRMVLCAKCGKIMVRGCRHTVLTQGKRDRCQSCGAPTICRSYDIDVQDRARGEARRRGA